jgi:transcriptional regulator with XRE-family HTH domain
MINVHEILDRIKEKEGFTGRGSDKDLADFLKVAKQTLSSWRSRESFDFRVVLEACEHYDLNWLLTGEKRKASVEIESLLKAKEIELKELRSQRECAEAQTEILEKQLEKIYSRIAGTLERCESKLR